MSGGNSGPAPVIRIVKKKKIEAAHHGGAWKVAYADFVTAMMAFFLVMWIISMDQPVKEQIQDYFNNPFSTSRSKAGISKMSTGGRSPIAIGVGIGLNAKNWRDLAMEIQRDRFVQAQHTLTTSLAQRPDLSGLRNQVEIQVTSSGLTINLIEADRTSFFQSGSAVLPRATVAVLALVARELRRLPNAVFLEGHTDVVPYPPGAAYTNWELSTDRAHAARRALEAAGLPPRRIMGVRGFADRHLRHPSRPTDPGNRRIAIHVPFQGGDQAADLSPKGPGMVVESIRDEIKPRRFLEPPSLAPGVREGAPQTGGSVEAPESP